MDVTDFSYIHLFFVDLRCVAVCGIIQKGKLLTAKPKTLEVFLMARSNLNAECEDLELIIDGLAAGKETYHEEEAQYSLEEALGYLRDFLHELKELNGQITESGNTPELLEEVYKKYTELWLFQLYSMSIAFLVLLAGCGATLMMNNSMTF